jgi:hypothetical protein
MVLEYNIGSYELIYLLNFHWLVFQNPIISLGKLGKLLKNKIDQISNSSNKQ